MGEGVQQAAAGGGAGDAITVGAGARPPPPATHPLLLEAFQLSGNVELARRVLAGEPGALKEAAFARWTAMQVRGGGVRGREAVASPRTRPQDALLMEIHLKSSAEGTPPAAHTVCRLLGKSPAQCQRRVLFLTAPALAEAL